MRTIPSFYPKTTGPAYQARNISQGLIDRGHEAPIYTTTDGAEDEPNVTTIDDIPVRRFQPLSKKLPYALIPGILPSLSTHEIDVLHAHAYRNFLSDSAFVTSRLRRIPFVLQTHGTLLGYRHITMDNSTWQYRLYDTLTRRYVAQGADRVVVSTSLEQDEAIAFGIPEERIRVIPIGKDIDRYRSVSYSPPEDTFRLLLVGRLDPSRNVEPVIKAMASLPDDIELRIVGGEASVSIASESGYLDRLKSLAREQGVSNAVSFVGPKYGQDLIGEYRSAHVFVYTSRYENFGQTILEAAAAGLPIIATPVGVANDLIDDGKTGFLVAHEDPDAIVRAVVTLRESNREAVGCRLQREVKNKYDWNTIIDDYERMYTKLIEEY